MANANGFGIPDDNLSDKAGPTSMAWLQWFQRVQNVATALSQSGPTATRPATGLWIGRRYFDTDLGIPVWVSAVKPAVWVDATGATV